MREGIIPAVLGAAVTATGTAMGMKDIRKRSMRKRDVIPLVGAGLVGVGLAHVVLGSIDIVQHRH